MTMSSEDYTTNGVMVKESSLANSSSRIYYYGTASVPFLWETRPGTPKKDSMFSESFRLPPLTPPPSYYSSSSSENKQSKVRTKQYRFVKTLFNKKRLQVSRPSSFSWSSSTTTTSSSYSASSSSSSFSSSSPPRARKCYLSCSRSLVKEEDDEEEIVRRSTSLCCKRVFSSSMGSMKRALCSVLSINGSTRNDLRFV